MASEILHPVISASNVAIGFRDSKKEISILRDLNFAIPTASLTAIVGANGIGKSTLLRTLCKIQPTLEGDLYINEQHFKSITAGQLALQLSVVLTEVPASKNVTVLELISLGRQPHTGWMGNLNVDDKNAIEKAIILTEIEDITHKKCYELSDGQLQRVYIARALAQDTPIIILDEPTTHLDLYHRASILKLLKKLVTQENKTIIFTTHEIDLVIPLVDQMIILQDASLIIDTPEKLIETNKFDTLFPSSIIKFDKNLKRFIIQ